MYKKNEINAKKLKNINPIFCIICTPTIFHLKHANYCLEKNIPVYIDKPLGYKENKSDLKKIFYYSKKQTIHFGFNLKYCNELNIFIKKIKKINNFKTAKFVWNTDMRKWHPKENYKTSYAYKKSLGGGVIHTCSHEINILNDFFDEFRLISVKKFYKEKICSSYNAKFKSKRINISVNIDFMSQKNQRYIIFESKNKKYKFDFYDYNYKLINDRSYILSLVDFIKCQKKNNIPKSNYLDAIKTYKILEKMNNG